VFAPEAFQTPLEELVPSKKAAKSVKTTPNFKLMVSSIQWLGLMEQRSVSKADSDVAKFLLLDGNLRVRAFNVNLSTNNSWINPKATSWNRSSNSSAR